VKSEEGRIRAAGAVLWRRAPDGPRVALVHRPRYDDWSFPKGKVDAGEHVLGAALREVVEETGIAVRLGRRLPSITYLKDGRPKQVDYWSATPIDAEAVFVPNEEVDRLEWLPVAEAVERLSYERDAQVLREFAAGPLTTRPVVILRHALAGRKSDWRDDDALRPLDDRGRAQARALAALLGVFGRLRPVSSATARCVETLLPYALASGGEVTTDRAFTVGRTDAGRAGSRLVELACDGADPLVVCTHGEIVGDLIAELCRKFGEPVPDDPSLRKGGFWVAHLAVDDDGTSGVAALERHWAPPS